MEMRLGGGGSMNRGWSLPPGNPLWSARARTEWGLTQLRPRDLPEEVEMNAVDLPVPNDAEFGDTIHEEREQRAAHRRATPRGSLEWGDRFKTPRSGKSKEKGKSVKGGGGVRSQGPLPRTPVGIGGRLQTLQGMSLHPWTLGRQVQSLLDMQLQGAPKGGLPIQGAGI